MDDFSFAELLAYQAANTKLTTYENEFALLEEMFVAESSKLRRRMTEAWLQALDKRRSVDGHQGDMIHRSKCLREEGNRQFMAKGAARNLLGAGRSYTKAIFAAPSDTETLALAHANRAMVLQEFGYFQQAYDDCECALAEGRYPERLRHKIITRQAHCAWQRKDAELLRRHLRELAANKLNANFAQQLQELRAGLAELLSTKDIRDGKCEEEKDVTMIEKTQVVKSGADSKGRCMITTQPIKMHEMIFRERISSFVPVGGQHICQQCAVTLMVPFPCLHCRGEVTYCSTRCKQAHLAIHVHECVGHRWQLLNEIGIAQLALRVVLEELPAVAPRLRDAADAAALWFGLTAANGIVQQKGLNYMRTLSLISHLSQMTLGDIKQFALVADFLGVYLQKYTSFFDIVTDTSRASSADWQLVTVALILRHIGQFIANAHTCISLLPVSAPSTAAVDCGFLLAESLWQRPFLVQRGFLHQLSNFGELSAANLPYLSICNHACAPTFQPRFAGRHLTAFAKRDLCTGEEILNCYTPDYRISLTNVRRAHLQEIYRFECECTKCTKPNPDEEYLKYHRYRCSNRNCGKVFVPGIESLNWWQSMEDDAALRQHLVCSSCGQAQPVDWFSELTQLLRRTDDVRARKLLFQKFKDLDTFLLDFHSLKQLFAVQLLNACFQSHNDFVLADADLELEMLANAATFSLRAIADQRSTTCIEYAAAMTYVWDLIAVKKHKCSRKEMRIMLDALTILSDEYQTVFWNYYENYMKELVPS